MNKAEWGAIKYFTPDEFDSPDKPGSGLDAMQYDLIRALDRVRERVGAPIHINSGYRTKAHNAEIGGRKNSAHLRGWAADLDLKGLAKALKVSLPRARSLLLAALDFADFHRMGIYPTFVHADMDPSLQKGVTWVEGE